MILITSRHHEIASWIEGNCVSPSRYTIGQAWSADLIERLRDTAPVEIALDLTAIDQCLFDINFAGWFVQHPRNRRWYDATELNRSMIELSA